MVQDAEENAENDKILKAKVEGRNKLESYLYNVKSTTSEQTFQAKLTSEEKTLLSEAVSDGLEWLELTGEGDGDSADSDSEQRSAEEFEEKLQEVEAIVGPIMSRVYQASSGASAGQEGGDGDSDGNMDEDGGDSDSGGDSGPTVEEA